MKRPSAHLVSEEEFLSLPESLDKIELIDGEVILTPSPNPLHQQIVLGLGAALNAWAERQPGPVSVFIAPLDVRFAPDRILQPDAFVVFAAVPMSRSPIDCIPELCAEVLSSNRAHDRVTKRMVYAAAGVKEYWVVDPANRLVERFTGDELSRREEVRETLVTPLLSGFTLDLPKLFGG